jgi:hypothetical protein
MRLLGALAVASRALLGTGCPETDGGPCSGEESVVVKMTGTCAVGERTFAIQRSGCNITLSPQITDAGVVTDAGPGASPATLGLPTRGTLGQNRAPVRQGGWSVWGCLMGTEQCPDQFLLCSTRRTGFQLDVTCLDGTGAIACEAVLTE